MSETNELSAGGAKQKRGSYSENGTEANSKEDVLLQHVEISVSESEKRANGSLNLREYYTVYLIETKAIDPEYEEKLSKLETVWRRYTEFEQLRDYLEATYPYVVLPPLPEKRVMFGWQKLSTDTFDPDFVDRRRAGLENFLLRVAAHSVLSWDEHFVEFLRHEDGWRESLRANGYLQVAESKLKSLNVSVRLKNADPHFDDLKTYAGAFHTNIYNLLKARSRVAEKQYTVYKLHRNYGRVFSEWSAVEREMGDALQKTGHYLDSLASSIDASLEDEELLVDQLKEYLFFATSLQNVCRHQEQLRYAVEVAEENVAAKNVERVKAQQGKLGLMSRLFGAVDTDEVRELKVNVLDQQIQEGAIAVNKANEELKPREASEEGLTEGGKVRCPAAVSRLRVEKIDGGLMVAGVVVAANCQIILPIFGFLFLLVGCVLTAASYRGPGEDEEPDDYAERIAFTGNSRVLGPTCIVFGFIMTVAGIVLCILTRRARQREQTVGFHCPLHGDFYPLSPVTSSKTIAAIENGNKKSFFCWSRRRGPGAIAVGPPQCPHSQVSSTRSSLASSPHSQCPTPLPFLVNSVSFGGMVPTVAQLSPDQPFGSIRSLAVSREVASFPMSRTPTPPPSAFESLVSPNLVQVPDEEKLFGPEQDEPVVNPRNGPRKSVSIVLPSETG